MAAPALLDRSRVVRALKLVLPLVALALLSMVFLLASPVDPTRALQTAEIDVAERARDPRLSAARFAGVTDTGAALRIEAASARSDPGGTLRFQVEGLALRLDGTDGRVLTAQAQSGRIDRGEGRFSMEGDLRIDRTPDARLQATRLQGSLDRTRIEAEGPVTGRLGPAEVEAGHLSIRDDPASPGSLQLVFTQGVRFIYRTAE